MDEKIRLTQQDYNDIIESLQYTIKAKEEYLKYPSYEYKTKTISDTQSLISKIRELKKQA